MFARAIAAVTVLTGVFLMSDLVKPSLVAEADATYDSKIKHEQMLYPVVRVRTERSAGSGTVVWSGKAHDGWHTFVLTNHHVIEDAIKIEKKWDAKLGREVKREFRSAVTVEFFQYNNLSKNIGATATQADVVAWDDRQDLALLETRDRETSSRYVAAVMPIDNVSEVRIYDRLFAVGAALAHPPISTEGILNYLDDEIDNMSYWMSSSQIIFGNSGGAVFRWSPERGRYEFLGVPSRVAVTFTGVVTHMGYFVPPKRVFGFLEGSRHRFIYSPTLFTYESELKVRDKEREEREKAELRGPSTE